MSRTLNNYIYNSIYQVLAIIIPLITTPYLTRTLGANSLGISTYVLSVVTMYQTIGNLGIDTYSRREVAYVKAKKGNLKTVFCELLLFRCILLFVSTVAYLPFLFDSEYSILYIIHVMTILGYFADISWFFIGMEDMKLVVIRNMIIKLVSTVLIFVLIRSSDDLVLYVIIYALTHLLSSLCMYPALRKYLSRVKLEKMHIQKHIKPILLLFLPQAATTVYVQFDKIMLGMLSSDISYVTIYEKAEVIAKLPLKFVVALSTVVLPKTAGLFASNNKLEIQKLLSKIMNLTILMILPAMIGLALVSDVFVPLYLGNEYTESVRVLQILSISVIAIAFSNITGIQYLMAVNSTKVLTVSYISAAVINFVLNYVFIQMFNANGAAIATVFAEIVVFIIQYSYMVKHEMQLFMCRGLFKRLVCIAIMVALILLIKLLLGSSIVSGVFQIIAGGLGYFGFIILLKDEGMAVITKKLLRK